MSAITPEFKLKVIAELLTVRKNFDGSDSAFAKQWSINNSVYSRLKNGETGGLLKDTQWITLGRELNVTNTERQWKAARTDIFSTIEEEVLFCKKHSKARICVDECEVGKSFTGKYLSRTLKNCFYIDCSQAKSKQLFIRTLAKIVGIDNTGKYSEVKANLKYYIKMLPLPIIIVDEAGDLDYTAFLELKELWNATEEACGWYMMGADGLQEKISRGIRNKKVGFREIFSRFSGKFTTIVPTDSNDRMAFYRKLITDFVSINIKDKSKINEVVKKSLIKDREGNFAGLRRAKALILLLEEEA